MNKKIIKQIFLQNNLGVVKTIKKIEVGFTNDVYSINDKLILKICKDESSEEKFEKEMFFIIFSKLKFPLQR